MESSDNDGVHRLEGVNESKGGLIIRKKNPDKDVFKKPEVKASLLGLDKLAGKLILTFQS